MQKKLCGCTLQSVVLEHRDTNNSLIEPKQVEWPDFPIVAPFTDPNYFSKTYDKADLPKEIIEIVRIELKIGDETKVFEYRFLLKYQKAWTVFDELMGI